MTSYTTPLKILYICTHNRCRSVLFEAITNQRGQVDGEQRLMAKSAGSAPAGEVHPLTLKYLQQAGYATNNLTSNSWDDSEYMAGFEPDVLITVCDNAAGEVCPVWLNSLPKLTKLHLGLADPSKEVQATDSQNEQQGAQKFADTIAIIEQVVQQLQQIPDLPLAERQQAFTSLAEWVASQRQ